MDPKKIAQNVAIAAGVSGWVGIIIHDTLENKKRKQRIAELRASTERTRQMRADLEARVIPALDRQLEAARFWNIVTHDM